VKKSEHFAVLG